VAAQLVRPINSNLYIAVSILETGLSPLLLATLSFLRTVSKNSSSDNATMTRGLHILGSLGTVALVPPVYGGSLATNSSEHTNLIPSDAPGAFYLPRFTVSLSWCMRLRTSTLETNGRALLIGISSVLPFLGVCMIYAVLSSFSGSPSSSICRLTTTL